MSCPKGGADVYKSQMELAKNVLSDSSFGFVLLERQESSRSGFDIGIRIALEREREREREKERVCGCE
jgi:hypothetical protein